MSDTHRYSVAWGRIGSTQALMYFPARVTAQALGEHLQMTFVDMSPSKFCRLGKHASRWRSEQSDGRYVEVSDTQHYSGWALQPAKPARKQRALKKAA